MDWRTSIKVRIARTACAPVVGRVIAAVLRDRIPCHGCVVDTRDPEITASTKASLFWGFYESAEIRFVRRLLRPDLDVVELGSSIGVVASQVARRLQPGRRLVCVEANPRLLPLLSANVRANAPAIDLRTMHGAIDYASDGGETSLQLGETNIDSRLGVAASGAGVVRVPSLTLQQVLDASGLAGDYGLVSDIEGAEAGLFLNELQALKRCKQLVVELHDATFAGARYTVEALLGQLTSTHGFRLVARHGPVCVLER